jgi:hypothetical protein
MRVKLILKMVRLYINKHILNRAAREVEDVKAVSWNVVIPILVTVIVLDVIGATQEAVLNIIQGGVLQQGLDENLRKTR